MTRRPPRSTLVPYTPLFRAGGGAETEKARWERERVGAGERLVEGRRGRKREDKGGEREWLGGERDAGGGREASGEG